MTMTHNKNAKEETDNDYIVEVQWLDGLYERFNAKQLRISDSIIWMRLIDNRNRSIPTRNVRWYATYPEIHGED